MVNPRSLRWTAVAEKMVELGWDVHLICSKVIGEPEQEVIKGVNVYRVGVRSQTKPGSQVSAAKVGFARKLLKLVYNKVARYFIWPDSNVFWIKPAVAKAKDVVQSNDIKNMISISHPFSGHVVGFKLSKLFKDLKWVMDIGDPFAFLEFVSINNKFLFNRCNFSYEKKLIKKSDKQCVTTPLTTQEYLKHGYDCKDSMVVIPPLLRRGYEPDKSNHLKGSEVNWIFVGTLYKKIRSPIYLLKLFSAIAGSDQNRSHKLHFYGETKMCADDFEPYKHLLGEKIFLHGLVRPEVAKLALQGGDLLINIGNKTSYQLPSKLVEYMALGKRIINIKSISNDSSEEFLKNYELAIFINESKSIESQMKLILENLDKEISISDLKQNLKPYTADSIGRSYLSLFD